MDTTVAVLTWVNGILNSVPAALAAYQQIKAAAETSGTDAEVQAMLDQIAQSVAATRDNLKELGIEVD